MLGNYGLKSRANSPPESRDLFNSMSGQRRVRGDEVEEMLQGFVDEFWCFFLLLSVFD